MPTFTNISNGPRGIHDASGNLVMIAPGKSADIAVSEIELADALNGEWFEVSDADADTKGGNKPRIAK